MAVLSQHMRLHQVNGAQQRLRCQKVGGGERARVESVQVATLSKSVQR